MHRAEKAEFRLMLLTDMILSRQKAPKMINRAREAKHKSMPLWLGARTWSGLTAAIRGDPWERTVAFENNSLASMRPS